MLKTIPVSELRCGMYISHLCGAWMDHPFWRNAFAVDDPSVIEKIVRSAVTEVVIDTERGVDVAAFAPISSSALPVSAPASAIPPATIAQPLSVADEIDRAKGICLQTKVAVESMLHEVRLGRALNAAAAMPLVSEIASSVLRNPNALISVARLKHADDYTYLHSVAVCALMVALARQLGLDATQTHRAGVGGLLHDIGKAWVPLPILNKPGKLSEDEFAVIREHPEQGHRILIESGVDDAEVLNIVLHHHEKADGSGYPHGLDLQRSSRLARMAVVCDVYDAITSNRPYKAGWDPAESIRRMSSWKGHFDSGLLNALIRSLGIYPIGTLVRLASDHLGVVVEQHAESLLTPQVRVFYSAKSDTQLAVHTVDLADPHCNDRIVGIESPGKWGFRNLELLWLP